MLWVLSCLINLNGQYQEVKLTVTSFYDVINGDIEINSKMHLQIINNKGISGKKIVFIHKYII